MLSTLVHLTTSTLTTAQFHTERPILGQYPATPPWDVHAPFQCSAAIPGSAGAQWRATSRGLDTRRTMG